MLDQSSVSVLVEITKYTKKNEADNPSAWVLTTNISVDVNGNPFDIYCEDDIECVFDAKPEDDLNTILRSQIDEIADIIAMEDGDVPYANEIAYNLKQGNYSEVILDNGYIQFDIV